MRKKKNRPDFDAMITGSKVKLRPKRLTDALNDYAWQADPDLARLDAVSPLNIAYPAYLLAYAVEFCRPSSKRCHFAIETMDGKHIGNCIYYGIDGAKGEAELGIMIGNRDYWDKGYGTDAVTVLVNHIFRQTKLNRIYLKTLELNHRAQKCFQKCGFTPCGRMVRDGYRFVLMEMQRKRWEEKYQSPKAEVMPKVE